jgi:hypothetical protein
VDWGRAKLWLIIAFAFLDAFLGWQVTRLHVARVLGQAPRATGAGYLGPGTGQSMPLLAVTTVGWQEPVLRLLANAQCTAEDATQRAASTSFRCSGSGGATLSWFNGLVVFSPGPGLAAGAGANPVATLMGELHPDPLAPGAGGKLVAEPGGQYQVFETYDGHPLFNGNWTVTVSKAEVVAQRWWLEVVQTLSAPRTVVAAARARDELVRKYGKGTTVAAGTEPLLGYYNPTEEAPGDLWYLAPVWRIDARFDCGRQQVVYVDAFTAQSAVPNTSPCPAPQGGS